MYKQSIEVRHYRVPLLDYQNDSEALIEYVIHNRHNKTRHEITWISLPPEIKEDDEYDARCYARLEFIYFIS
jgi:hypothetical protein